MMYFWLPFPYLTGFDVIKFGLHLVWNIRVWNIRVSTQPYLMSDVIVTTKGKRVLEFLCSKTLIFQIPLYFKLGVIATYFLRSSSWPKQLFRHQKTSRSDYPGGFKWYVGFEWPQQSIINGTRSGWSLWSAAFTFSWNFGRTSQSNVRIFFCSLYIVNLL